GSNGAGSNGTGSTRTGSDGAGASRSSATGSGTSPQGNATSTRTVSAEQITADQASIDAAAANLVLARQNLAQATLDSPIAGTVADIGLTVGGSSSGSITVIGSGGYVVDTTVPLASIDLIKKGQPVAVTVDGISAPLSGSVTYISVLGATSGSSTSYSVTVALATKSQRLFDGTGASLAITTGKVSDVLTVPTSAVQSMANRDIVTVLEHGKTATKGVTVGAVGPARTEIKSGLSDGQQVVLAVLSEPIPNSNNTSNMTRRLTGGSSGLTGNGGGLGGTMRIGG
ncbi:MAG: HlyD family efflux transporter periplasmic adaptor subunit, partial [Actinomycetia bacterium]|nr:HlyD family efflux transporter periplasmic adaptor subunit [Actinomycetes bacterium]